MKIRLAIAALVGAVILAPVGMAWADYPPSAPTVQLLSSSATCGDTVGVTGSNWMPNTFVDLTLQNPHTFVGSAAVNGAGEFSTTFIVPANFPVGMHELDASGTAQDGTNGLATTNLNVLGTNCGSGPPNGSTTTTPGGGSTTTTPGGGSTTTTPGGGSTTTTPGGGSTTTTPGGGSTTTTPGGGSTTIPGGGGSTTTVTILGEQHTNPNQGGTSTGVQGEVQGSSLPFTGGAYVTLLVTLGLGLLAAGSVAVVTARRRRTTG